MASSMIRSKVRRNKAAMIGMKTEEDNRDDDVSNYNNDRDDQAVRE